MVIIEINFNLLKFRKNTCFYILMKDWVFFIYHDGRNLLKIIEISQLKMYISLIYRYIREYIDKKNFQLFNFGINYELYWSLFINSLVLNILSRSKCYELNYAYFVRRCSKHDIALFLEFTLEVTTTGR